MTVKTIIAKPAESDAEGWTDFGNHMSNLKGVTVEHKPRALPIDQATLEMLVKTGGFDNHLDIDVIEAIKSKG